MNKCKSNVIKEEYIKIYENRNLFSVTENEKIPHVSNLNR